METGENGNFDCSFASIDRFAWKELSILYSNPCKRVRTPFGRFSRIYDTPEFTRAHDPTLIALMSMHVYRIVTVCHQSQHLRHAGGTTHICEQMQARPWRTCQQDLAPCNNVCLPWSSLTDTLSPTHACMPTHLLFPACRVCAAPCSLLG